jgi:2-polyprenyl-3-methyl-5-hydroxy-6-metoxy-1,4-benzoquinol methylase
MSVWTRLQRAWAMDRRTLADRIRARFADRFSPARNLRRVAYRLDRLSRRAFAGPYVERAEAGPVNLVTKRERVRAGGPCEPYEIVLINRAAERLLDGAVRIAEVGAGTGIFASWAVSRDGRRHIVASEFDDAARAWAIEHRSAPNITYDASSLEELAGRSFDVVVALEVIEHLTDYRRFLRDLVRVAPMAILSTPNKQADPFQSVARTPAFSQHVREWNAGEFYWVLRGFYAQVELFTILDQAVHVRRLRTDPDYVPPVVPCTDLSSEAPLLARCRRGRVD